MHKLNNSHSKHRNKKAPTKSIMTVSMLYTTGLHQEVFTFVDVAEKSRWEAEVMAIKADSSAAFHQKETNGITTAVRTLYDNWIARVMAFKELYSEYKVPMDIKWAVNSAQEALGLEKTQWDYPPQASIFE